MVLSIELFNNSIYQLFLSNINNLHTTVWLQQTNYYSPL